MRNFISPNSHPSSFYTGSTLESMIDKAVKLDTGYYSCTDNGFIQNNLKAYSYAKKKGIKLISGCELYFIDRNCPFTNNVSTRKIKYYTITVHAKTQEAYQMLVKMISDKKRSKITILDKEYPSFDWSDLEELSKSDFTIVSGGPNDLICKPWLVGDIKSTMGIFNKLHGMFKENLFTSIIPLSMDKKWASESVISFSNGDTVTLDSSLMVETAFARNYRVSLGEVAEHPARHRTIKRIYINEVGYKVNKDVVSGINRSHFKEIGLDIFQKYNSFIKMLSTRSNVKMLINDYSYFSEKDDKLAQNMKLGNDLRFYANYSIKTTDEVVPYLKETGFSETEIEELVNNTYEWAKLFDSFELKYEYRLVKDYDDPLAATMDIIKRVGRFDENNPEHVKRLEHEIDVLHRNGIVDLLPYFFPIEKAINYCKVNRSLVGVARGSSGGSILMYFLGINQVDPLKYNLQFSRFLTLGRIKSGSLPDVDCDFSDRSLLTEPGGFLDSHYKNRWAQISTRSLMRLKSSIKDVNRFVKGEVEEEIETFTKNLPPTPQGASDLDFVFGYEKSDGSHVPGLIEKDEKLLKYTLDRPDEWEIVKKNLGIARQTGRHASAFCISDIPVTDIVPIMKVKETENVTQYEAKEVEDAGLIKYDFLVIKCLNDIQLCMELVNKKHREETGETFIPDIERFYDKTGTLQYIWDLPEDPEVYKMLGDGGTETIFQLHTVSVLPYITAVKPSNITDLATITSLVRPGPLDFIDKVTGRNMAEEYVERRQGNSKGDIPVLDELIPETHSILTFQEQIKLISQELTGWDDEKAEDIRIAVGKKKLKMIAELKPQFLEAAKAKGRVDDETALKIWNMMETFGGYGFNKSHAVSYAIIAYACSYLKHHYPLEWWASVLSNAPEKEITEVLWPYIKNILSPPDINLSQEEMVIDYRGKTIRNKLSILRGMGAKLSDKITAGRPYKDVNDLVQKKIIGAAMTRKLIHIGVLDSLFDKDYSIMDKMQEFEDCLQEMLYRNKIKDKLEGDIDINLPLDKFMEISTKHIRTRRMKHVIKKGKIEEKYIFMNPIKDYILKKTMFPAMPLNLYDILKDKANSIAIQKSGNGYYCIDKRGIETRFVSGTVYDRIRKLPCQPRSTLSVGFCVAGYVIEAKEFSYKKGTKKALKINIDIDGILEEMVIWPDYDTGVLKYPDELKKGCVAFLFMYRKMGKEVYHTNIASVVVEDIIK